ncbi:tetratricopeptide repeat protein [Candidatus Peregrinibacteria bacterium]|nr:tetratricopeptide repeat protein [Candidatus Peregrinibacteria bacterium]
MKVLLDFIERSSFWRHVLAACAFAFLGLLLYGPLLHAEFITLDDGLLIYQNAAVQKISWQTFRTIFTTYDPELYIPLTLLSYQIDFAMGGTEPFVYHLHHLLLHMLVAGVFTLILRELHVRMPLALGIGFLFLVHPLHGEAALWASARKDVLSTLFFALSIWSYLRYRAVGSGRWYGASLATFTLGLLAKVSVIPLPFILLLIDDLQGRRFSTRTLLEKAPFIFVALIFGIVAIIGKAGGMSPSLMDLLLASVQSAGFMLSKFFLPWNLSILYPFERTLSLASPSFLLSLGTLGTLAIGTALLRRRSRVPFFAFWFFLLLLAPSFFNLIKDDTVYLGSDRYAYAASFGLLFFLAWLLSSVPRRWRMSGLTVLLVLCFTLSSLNARHWRSNEALYRHVLSLYPGASIAHINLANVLRRAGNVQEALAHYDEALARGPNAVAHYNKGVLFAAQGKAEQAEAEYRQALTLRPSYALAWINLGKVLYERGEAAEARVAFEEAVRFAPHLATAHFNLGVLAGASGQYASAEESYRRALSTDPLFVDARVNLVGVLLALQKAEEAHAEVRVLLRQAPDHPHVRQLLDYLYQGGIVTPE